MSKSTVLRSASATLWFHEDKKIVHHKLHKFIYGEELRALFTAGSELIRQRGATKWLSDDRDSPAVSHQDEEWANTVFIPTTIAAGWKHWAIVLPRKIVGQIAMDRLSKELSGKGLQVGTFDDPDEALAWLESA